MLVSTVFKHINNIILCNTNTVVSCSRGCIIHCFRLKENTGIVLYHSNIIIISREAHFPVHLNLGCSVACFKLHPSSLPWKLVESEVF